MIRQRSTRGTCEGPAAGSRLAAASLGALALACGRGPEPAAAADVRGERDLDGLRALGYVAWDEGADAALSGERLHAWRLPGARQVETFELEADGSIVALAVDEALVKLTWDSEVVWRLELPVHHDVRRLEGGGYLVLAHDPPRDYRGRRVLFDRLVRVSADGRASDVWSTWERLAELQRLHPPLRLDAPRTEDEPAGRTYDYYHANCVEVLRPTALGERDPRFRAGNLLVCLPNADLVAVLDRDTLDVTWSWGPGELDFVHTPTLLPAGTLLLFDNGERRGSSRVLELDPVTGRVVWSFAGTPPASFFSRYRGSAQRLPNGDTLICESERGHAFEVTRAGEVVWELWNPELRGERRRRIYRYARLAPALVEPILASLGVPIPR